MGIWTTYAKGAPYLLKSDTVYILAPFERIHGFDQICGHRSKWEF